MAALGQPIPRTNLYLYGQEEYKLRMENIIRENTNLDQFTYLNISKCILEFAGYQVPIVDAIRNMKNLTTLRLNKIELCSSTFLEIESKELKQLHLSKCKTPLPIASLFKNDLCYKDSLVKLSLDGIQLTEIPNGIFEFRNLLKLSLIGNQITELPDKFTNFSKLEHLSLSNNQLRHVPSSIFELQSLLKLSLIENLISELPNVFANSSKLQVLALSSNQLTHVPASIFALQNLSALSLNINHITELPDKFTNLPKLETLLMHNNQLRSVPPSIFALQNLSTLSLNGNLITALPDMFTNIPKLKYLSITRNQLEYLPISVLSLHLNHLGIADNEFNFGIAPSDGSEMILHSLKELTYRAILKHKLKVEEGMLPKKVLKDLANFCQCICGCKFVNGIDLLFFCNLKGISRVIKYNRDAHLVKFPMRGKMCTSLNSCFHEM